jgi:hypothetical protein
VANFSSFLDELAKQPAKDMKPEVIRFIAFSYAGLDKHAKAAELLAKIPKPEPSQNADPEKKQKEDQERQAFYHAARLLYARELRLGKQYEEAGKVLKEITSTEQGKRSIDAQKEQNFLLEDQEKYAPAFRAWDAMMKMLKPQVTKDAKIKEQYYECYYHLTYCYAKNAAKIPDDAKRREAMKKAAGFITKLESNLPDMGGEALKKRYEELLQKEPLLKEQYDELKKTSQ